MYPLSGAVAAGSCVPMSVTLARRLAVTTCRQQRLSGAVEAEPSAYMTEAYRHLLEGHKAEAAERFEDYLIRAANLTPTA